MYISSLVDVQANLKNGARGHDFRFETVAWSRFSARYLLALCSQVFTYFYGGVVT